MSVFEHIMPFVFGIGIVAIIASLVMDAKKKK